VILGILAAYAVPKFMAIDREARIAVVQGLEGSLRTAADMSHGVANAQGLAVGAVSIDIGRGNIVTFTNGYPDASNAGIVSTLADVSGFSINVTATTVTFEKNGAPVPANCAVSYSYNGAATSTPAIVGTTSGC
jgi:MSHA pilin protein MshA